MLCRKLRNLEFSIIINSIFRPKRQTLNDDRVSKLHIFGHKVIVGNFSLLCVWFFQTSNKMFSSWVVFSIMTSRVIHKPQGMINLCFEVFAKRNWPTIKMKRMWTCTCLVEMRQKVLEIIHHHLCEAHLCSKLIFEKRI